MVALMNLDINKTDKLNGFVNEAKSMGIKIIPPDINTSTAEFSCKNGKIVYALGAIKGMGVNLAMEICKIRDEKIKNTGKAFKNLQDFFESCGTLMNKKVIESLAKSGAWKSLNLTIRTVLENEASIVDTASEFTRNLRENGKTKVINMFGLDNNTPQLPTLKQYDEYSDDKLSALEFEIFGFYMNTHPLDPYRDKIEDFKFEEGQDALDTIYKTNTRILMCGVITEIKMRFKNRKKFAFINLLDLGGMYETSVFNDDLINQKADLLVEGKKVAAEVEATTSAETGTRLQIKDIYDLDDFFKKYKKRSDIKLGVNKKRRQSTYGSVTGGSDISCNSKSNSEIYSEINKKSTTHKAVSDASVVSDTYGVKASSVTRTTDTEASELNNSTGLASGDGNNLELQKSSVINADADTLLGANFKKTQIKYKDFVVINIETEEDIRRVKSDIDDGRYKGKKLLLKINDSELLVEG